MICFLTSGNLKYCYFFILQDIIEEVEKNFVFNEVVGEGNDMHFPAFLTYFITTWASNIALWSAAVLSLVKTDVKFNNQVRTFDVVQYVFIH